MNRLLAVLLLSLIAAVSLNASASAPKCGGIDQLPQTILEKRLVVFGEIHGTNEIPALVGQVACALLASNREVVVALEISSGEQERIDRFLASDGSPRAMEDMTSSSRFWLRLNRHHDGRASRAKLKLLETLRQFKSAGLPVTVLAADLGSFDQQSPRSGAQQRDDSMASLVIQALAKRPGAVVLGLFGNGHTALNRTVMNGVEYEPAGYQLRSQGIYSINVTFKVGSAWVCMPDCRTHDFSAFPNRPSPEPGFNEHRGPSRRYDATLALESISASAPYAVRAE